MKLILTSPAFERKEKCPIECTYKEEEFLLSLDKIHIIHFTVDSILILVLVQV